MIHSTSWAMHASHGTTPLHFVLRFLQASQALEVRTLRLFRRWPGLESGRSLVDFDLVDDDFELDMGR